jgi:hypothetical protein
MREKVTEGENARWRPVDILFPEKHLSGSTKAFHPAHPSKF